MRAVSLLLVFCLAAPAQAEQASFCKTAAPEVRTDATMTRALLDRIIVALPDDIEKRVSEGDTAFLADPGVRAEIAAVIGEGLPTPIRVPLRDLVLSIAASVPALADLADRAEVAASTLEACAKGG
jgi:hypothetical protein